MSFDLSADKEFESAVTDIQAKAVPPYTRSLVAALGGEDQVARTAAKNALAAYGRTAGEALVDGLGDNSEGIRAASLDLLVVLNGGRDFGFDPKKAPAGQEQALSQWRSWLAASPSADSLDPAKTKSSN